MSSSSWSALISVSGTYWPPKAPNRPDERADRERVLHAGARFDPARHVDAVGPELGHDLAHVTRFKTTRDEHLARDEQPARKLPVPRAPRAAALVGRPAVEHDRVGPVQVAWDAAVLDLQHLHHRSPAVEARRFRAVELEQVEVDELGDLTHLVGRLVDEHADDIGTHEHLVHDRLRLLGRDAAVGRAEVESNQVGARLDRRLRRLEIADPANLDPDQRLLNSRMVADGSGERINASPTRIASAPASRMRRASSAVWMPLSATSTISFGTRARTRSVSPRSTVKSRRLRWFTPTACAPASSAAWDSASSCTSTSAATPRLRATAMRSFSCVRSSAPTMSRTASAPHALASATSNGSVTKSLRRIGSSVAARTARMCSGRPPNPAMCVSTEIAAAPPSA